MFFWEFISDLKYIYVDVEKIFLGFDVLCNFFFFFDTFISSFTVSLFRNTVTVEEKQKVCRKWNWAFCCPCSDPYWGKKNGSLLHFQTDHHLLVSSAYALRGQLNNYPEFIHTGESYKNTIFFGIRNSFFWYQSFKVTIDYKNTWGWTLRQKYVTCLHYVIVSLNPVFWNSLCSDIWPSSRLYSFLFLILI